MPAEIGTKVARSLPLHRPDPRWASALPRLLRTSPIACCAHLLRRGELTNNGADVAWPTQRLGLGMCCAIYVCRGQFGKEHSRLPRVK